MAYKPPPLFIKLARIEALINGLIQAGLIRVNITKGGKLTIEPLDADLWEEDEEL